jgi:hypothetical protein
VRTVHFQDWYWYEGMAWKVNPGLQGQGLYTHILRALLKQFHFMLTQYRKVFVYRFDLRLNSYTADNSIISGFLGQLKRKVNKHYGTSKFAYIWVREQERSKQQHYHLAIMLDGNKIRHPHTMQKMIEELCVIYGLSPHWSRYHNIARHMHDWEDKRLEASKHLSYLAKTRTKGYRPTKTRDFSTSRYKQQ